MKVPAGRAVIHVERGKEYWPVDEEIDVKKDQAAKVEITLKRYGIRGFFRGLSPCLIRAFPANLTNFWVYESVLQLRERRLSEANTSADDLYESK